jgi:hypothetical protein
MVLAREMLRKETARLGHDMENLMCSLLCCTMVGITQMLALEHLKMVHDFIITCKYGLWKCTDAMLQETWESSNASSLGERFLTSRVSRKCCCVCLMDLGLWVYKDPAQNVYEMGFIVVHQLVPSEHWDTWSLHIYLYMKSMQLGWRSHIIIFSVFTQPSDNENYKNIYHLNPLSYLSMFTPLSPELDQLYLSVYCSITC